MLDPQSILGTSRLIELFRPKGLDAAIFSLSSIKVAASVLFRGILASKT